MFINFAVSLLALLYFIFLTVWLLGITDPKPIRPKHVVRCALAIGLFHFGFWHVMASANHYSQKWDRQKEEAKQKEREEKRAAERQAWREMQKSGNAITSK